MIFLFLAVQAFALSNSVPEINTYYDNVVTIRNEALDEERQRSLGYCNGTFISQNMIITAAHCLADAQVMQSFITGVQTGYYSYVKNPKGETVRVGYKPSQMVDVKSIYHFKPSLLQKLSRGYVTRIEPEEDVAIIELKGEFKLPPNITPAKVLPSNLRSAVLQNILEFQPTVVTVNFVEEAGNSDIRRSAVLNKISNAGGYLQSKSTSRIAPMDSGGPLFITFRGEKYVIGIVKGVKRSLTSFITGKPDIFSLADIQR